MVPFLRVQAERRDETVARQVIFYIRNMAREIGLNTIRITDAMPTGTTKTGDAR